MARHKEQDEYLEVLWGMREKGKDSVTELKLTIGDSFNNKIVEELQSEDLVQVSEDGRISMTPKGQTSARRIIRAHRLGERLICDVLGGKFEAGACEFEHMLDTGLLDSVCTLLGHPRQCPHGKPIPEGECCRRNAKVAESSVIPLTDLEPGVCACIAYVNGNEDQRVHKMGVLQIRPGAKISVSQKYPCYVLDCEGGAVAMGNEEVSSIYVWKPSPARPCEEECAFPVSNEIAGKKRGWRFRSKWKQRACGRN